MKALRFDTDLRDYKADDLKDARRPPDRDLGSMLLKSVGDMQGLSGRP